MKNIKVDWNVLAICDKEYRNKPNHEIEYRTIGFAKHGYGEIVVVGRVKNAEKIKDLINTFGRMLAGGEYFEGNVMHYIDTPSGKNEYRFVVVYCKYDDGEKWVQLVPDFEMRQ